MTVDRRIALALLLAATAARVPAGDAGVQVAQAWARPTVPGQAAAAVYARIDNRGGAADRLLGVSTPVAGQAQLHRMAMEGNVMRMREADALDIPPGGTVALAPGGLHLMLTALKQPLAAGSRFPLTLRFEKAGNVPVEVRVEAQAPR